MSFLENCHRYFVRNIFRILFTFLVLGVFPKAAFSVEDTAKWESYHNRELGFTVQHPKDWAAWDKKPMVYPTTVLPFEAQVCFAPVGGKEKVCQVELFVTQDGEKFKTDSEMFLGYPIFERAKESETPQTKDGTPTKRIDIAFREGEYAANIYFEKDKRYYLFVMKDFIKDQYDYLTFLSMISTFAFDSETSQPVVSARFKDFQDLKESDLSDVVVKLTFLGPTDKSVLTILLSAAPSDTLNIKRFENYRREGIFYGNDELSFTAMIATERQMKELVDAMSAHPALLTDRPAAKSYLSVSFLKEDTDGPKYFETVMDEKASEEFFVMLRNALKGDNRENSRQLQTWGCRTGLLPPFPAEDVSSRVEVLKSGTRFNATTMDFEQTVTLKNTSKKPIPGPVSLVLSFDGTSHLSDSDGTTCLVAPAGRSYVNVPLPSGRYGNFFPGEVLEIVLPFKVGEGETVSYSTQVLATSGER